jgi:putative spermidine/putrescine transport system substrate-binding protein
MTLSRRSLMTSALALGAVHAFPGLTLAQVCRQVFATFTGSWEEAHRTRPST